MHTSLILLGHRIQHIVIIAVRTVLIRLLKEQRVLPKHFLAFFARKHQLIGLFKRVVLHFVVAVRALEPFLAAGRSDGRLDVQDVLAHI